MSEETNQVMTTTPATESAATETKDTPDGAPEVEAKSETPDAPAPASASSDPPPPTAPAPSEAVHPVEELDNAGRALHNQGLSEEQIWRRLDHEGAAEIRHLAQMANAPRAPREDQDVAIEVVRGTFHGGRCPDKSARKFKQDVGFDYDAHHPAAPGEIVFVSASEAARLLKLPGGAFKKHAAA